MTKRQLIDEILTMNRSASPSFLAEFGDHDLSEYLANLLAVCGPQPHDDPWWPERHLHRRPSVSPAAANRGDSTFRRAAQPTQAPADGDVGDVLDDASIHQDEQPVLAGVGPALAPPRGASRPRQTSDAWLF